MDRKEIVKALGEYFETIPRYLGAPSFAYEIRTQSETYTVDRYGTITISDGTEATLEGVIGNQQTETHGNVEVKVPNIDNLELSLPMEGHTGLTLKNVINMISSKQNLIKMSIGIEDPIMDETFAEDLSLKKVDTIKDFKVAVEELGKERCKGINFDFDENIYTYNLPANELLINKITSFAVLATRINESAKKQLRTSYKIAQEENPKFAFRTWLIRLGMKGSNYKEVRKALLEDLEGNSAFRRFEERGDVN